MKLDKAEKIAQQIVTRLRDVCLHMQIAGSIRRRKADVGDIEIVCTPKLSNTPSVSDSDIFGGVTKKETTEQRHPAFIIAVNSLGVIRAGKPATGRYIKIWLPELIQLDLFVPQPYDYYRILAIRTGSAEFSKQHIASRWVAKGWRGTENGLRLEKECKQQGDKWICKAENPTLPPEWKSEQEFFKWLNVPYVLPEKRNL